jgi:hypothetical protein
MELIAINVARMEKPRIRILAKHTGEMPTAQRPTLNLTYSSCRGSRVGCETSEIAGGTPDYTIWKVEAPRISKVRGGK